MTVQSDIRHRLRGHTCYEGCADLLCLAAREIERLEADARRYRWLKPRRSCADFAYGEDKRPVVVIDWPAGVGVSGDFDRDIDDAISRADVPR